jgi:uncharacterized RDD family membrane protein YckC
VFPTDERDERERATVPAGLVLASIGRRLGGLALDWLLVCVPTVIGVLIAYEFSSTISDEISDTAVLVSTIALVMTAVVYQSLLVGFFGRTVGMIAAGIRVVQQSDGGRVGWWAAAPRAVVPVVFIGIPVLGVYVFLAVYGLAYLGPLRQGLHDRAAGTLVVLNGATVTV